MIDKNVTKYILKETQHPSKKNGPKATRGVLQCAVGTLGDKQELNNVSFLKYQKVEEISDQSCQRQ